MVTLAHFHTVSTQYAQFLKGQGHQGIFSLVKGILSLHPMICHRNIQYPFLPSAPLSFCYLCFLPCSPLPMQSGFQPGFWRTCIKQKTYEEIVNFYWSILRAPRQSPGGMEAVACYAPAKKPVGSFSMGSRCMFQEYNIIVPWPSTVFKHSRGQYCKSCRCSLFTHTTETCKSCLKMGGVGDDQTKYNKNTYRNVYATKIKT